MPYWLCMRMPLPQKSASPQDVASLARKVSIEYWFPRGMFSCAIVKFQAGYQASTGILFQLQTFRSVPDRAECVVNFALNGLKYLFSNGLASPRDVDRIHFTRQSGKQYATREFLIHAVEYKPISANDKSPRLKACHILLEGGLPDAGFEALRIITGGGHYDDFIDEAGLHSSTVQYSARFIIEKFAA